MTGLGSAIASLRPQDRPRRPSSGLPPLAEGHRADRAGGYAGIDQSGDQGRGEDLSRIGIRGAREIPNGNSLCRAPARDPIRLLSALRNREEAWLMSVQHRPARKPAKATSICAAMPMIAATKRGNGRGSSARKSHARRNLTTVPTDRCFDISTIRVRPCSLRRLRRRRAKVPDESRSKQHRI
jgi:hypothetical protein